MTDQWIVGSSMFDGTGFLDGPVTIGISGSTITEVSSGRTAPRGAQTIDVGAGSLLPGLIDAHVHLSFASEHPGKGRGADEPGLADRQRQNAHQTLTAGTTTVRDLGDHNYSVLPLAAESRTENTQLPYIVATGPPITTVAGHCWFLGGEVAHEQSDLLDAVADRRRRGVDAIKVMATGGNMTARSNPAESQFDTPALGAIVAAARPLPVVAHAHGHAGIHSALQARVAGIEHFSFMVDDATATIDWEMVRQVAHAGIAVGMTAGRLDGSPEIPVGVLPARTALHRYLNIGLDIACSSDAGISPERPHGVLRMGMQEFTRHLQAPIPQVLARVTIVPARHLGLGARKGKLAVGYDADVIAVGPGIVHDLGALTELSFVMREGTRIT